MTDGSLGSAHGDITLDVAAALAALKRVQDGIRGLGTIQPASGAGGFTGWVKQSQQSITTLGQGIATIGAVTLGAFGIGTKVTMDFDTAMSAVAATGGATAEELSKLRTEALRLGADTTFGATEAAAGMEVMLKAGAKVEDVYDRATEHVLNFAAATGTQVPLAAETATGAFNIFGQTWEKTADTITQSSNASALSVNDWNLALKSAGPVAAALGVGIDEFSGSLMILADNTITGEVAATALRNIMLNLSDTTNEGTMALADLGIATYDAQGNFRGMEAITTDLVGSWKNLNQEGRLLLAQQIAGKDGAAAFTAIMDAQVEAVDRGTTAYDEASAAAAGTGTAADQAAARMDNLKGSLSTFFGVIETLTIRAFTPLLVGLRSIVDAGTAVLRMLSNLPDPALAAMAAVTGLTGALAVLAGGTLLALPKILEMKEAWNEVSPTIAKVTSRLFGYTAATDASATSTRRMSFSLKDLAKSASSAVRNFARLHPAMLGFGLIGAGIFAAYQTNFLGFADLVDGMVAKVKSVGGAMLDAFNLSGESAKFAEDQVASYAKATKVVDGVTVYTAFRTNADGTIEEVGEIINSTESLDGKTTRVLIQGEDGPYWATIDLATGEISNATIPVVADTRSFTEKTNDALRVLEDSLRESGHGWAADIVDNVQGIVSAVSAAVSGIKSFFSGLGESFNGVLQSLGLGAVDFGNLSKQVAAAAVVLAPLALGLGLVLKTLSPLGPVLSAVSMGIRAVGLALTLAISPVGLIVLAIAALVAGLIYAYRNWEPFRKAVDKAAAGIKKFTLDKIVPALQKLGAFLADAGRAALDFLRGFAPLQNILSAAASIVQNLASAFSALFKGDWREFASGIASAFGNLLTIIGNLVITVPALLYEAFQAIDWGAVGSALASGFSSAWSAVSAAAVDLWGWITDSVGDINWGAIGGAIMSGIASALSAIGSVATDIWGWITDSLGNINWGAIGSAIVTGLSSAWAAVSGWIDTIDLSRIGDMIGNAAESVWGAATDLINGIVSAIGEAWTAVSGWIDTIDFGRIGSMISTAGEIVWAAATALIQGIVTAITEAWAAVSAWIDTIDLGRIGTKISAAGDAIASAARTVIEGVVTALSSAWQAVSDWIDTIDLGRIGDMISDAAGTIADAATAIIDGVVTALSTSWRSVSSWIDSIDMGRIGTQISDAATDLYNAATGIIDEVWRGIDESWQTIVAWGENIADTVIGWFTFDIPDPFGWFGGDSGKGDDNGGREDMPETTVPEVQAPSTTFDGKAIADAINAAVVAGLSGLSGGALAGAIENWVWRATGALAGRLNDDGLAIARGIDTGVNQAFAGAMSGGSLAASIGLWIGKAASQLAGLIAPQALSIARALDTAMLTAIATGMSGASLATSLGLWIGKAAGLLAPLLQPQALSIARALDTAMLVAIGTGMSGASLATSLALWIGKAAATMAGGVLNAPALAIARALDTAMLIAIGTGMSGASLATSLALWIGKATAQVGALLTEPAMSLARALDTAMVAAMSAMSGASLGTAVGQWMTRAIQLAVPTLTASLTAVTVAFQQFTATTSAAIGVWATQVTSRISQAMTESQSRITTFTSTSRSELSSWGSQVQSIVSSAMSAVTARISSAAQQAASSMRSGMQAVVSAVQSGMSAAVSAARSSAGAMEGAGADAIGGLVRGARSQLGALQSVVNQAIAIFSQIPALGNSPWPMMIGAGGDAMDGLVGGWVRRMPRLEKSINEVVDLFNVMPSMTGFGGAASFPAYAFQPATYSGSPSAGATYIDQSTYEYTLGDIVVQGTGDPKTTADAVFDRFQTAWTGVGKLK